MRTPRIVLPMAAASLIILSLSGGCAPKATALREEGGVAALRPPPASTMDVRLLSERPETPPKPPYSVADEMRGRWLTLFEVTVSPVSAGNLPGSSSAGDADIPASDPEPNP